MSDIEAQAEEPVVEPAAEAVIDEPVAEAPAAAPVETVAVPARSAADGYAMAAVICAVVGFVIPILPAAAALMLARATEPPHVTEPVDERVARLAGLAQTLAYISLSLITGFCAAMLLGILAKIVTN